MPKSKTLKKAKKSSAVSARVAKKVVKKSSRVQSSSSSFTWNPILTYIIIGLVLAFLVIYLAVTNDLFKTNNDVDSQALPANVQIATPSPTPVE
jgi:hypothetical protein